MQLKPLQISLHTATKIHLSKSPLLRHKIGSFLDKPSVLIFTSTALLQFDENKIMIKTDYFNSKLICVQNGSTVPEFEYFTENMTFYIQIQILH